MRAALASPSPVKSLLLAMLLASAAWSIVQTSEKPAAISTSRWEEGQPGCTFSRDDDGKYRYGFWSADYGVVLAVDSQELEKARRRAQPIFALQLTVHYRGKDSLDVTPGTIALEFVKHYHDVHSALDPDRLATNQQNDADALAERTRREVRKHPTKQAEQEAALAARQKDTAEMIEFLKTRSLRAMKLDSAHPEASGWVLFITKSKWIDGMHKQEEFVLRVPLRDQVVEFPFSLPPSEGDLILRSRPEK
jgi:hypothetical protein